MKKLVLTLIALLSLHFADSQSIQLDIKVFLEGPFLTGQMTTDLNYSDFLPLTQPYGSPPWNYGGVETVSAIPNTDIVDWVLIDLVSVTFIDDTAKLHVLDRKACFLIKTGLITDLDGMSLPIFQHDGQTSFHVRVHHRNHLNIISSSALTEDLGLFSWDFTTGSEKALGGVHTQKEFINGQWGMISSDGNASGQVDNVDKNEVWFPELGLSGYLFGDFNMNGQVDMDDKLSQWMLNTGRGSLPVRDSIVVPTFTCGDAITDIDGNIYNTVLIGSQCWMAENLKTTTYKNGTAIPNVTNGTTWENLTTGAYVWYNNDVNWKDSYGALYNWFGANDTNGICPEGWHVPSHDNWTILTDFIGGTSSPTGQKLKSCRRVNSPLGGDCNTSTHPRWNEDTWSLHYGTDDYGFSGLPGGYRYALGSFNIIGFVGIWWTSTEVSSLNALAFSLVYNISHVNFFDESRKEGYSIRCLKGIPLNQPPNQPTNPSPEDGATNVEINTLLSWTCSDPDGDELHYKIYFGTDPTPELIFTNHPDTFYLPGLLAYNTTYYWKITAYDIHGDSTEGSIWSFTTEPDPWTCGDQISDIDSNTYNTVQIGNQCWLKENLKTATYRNGTPIPNVTNSSNWTSLTTGAYAWYDNDINWKDKYGALYNWYAVVDPIGLCPEGWHVPSHIEWTALTTFIGGASSPNGNKLKSCRMVNSPLGGDCNTSEHPRWNQGFLATDDYGFSALPGGLRNENGLFYPIGYYGNWWTTTVYSATESYFRELGYDYGSVGVWYFHKRGGLSVRCLRD